ncbi:MAG: DivIVA domain-containing protein [Oscillospiraceae bacterium]|nr:DivIVA domain-containing protein [Oscillospiraceae bacterium]
MNAMNAMKNFFTEAPMGYNKKQVNMYIQKLSEEYTALLTQMTQLAEQAERRSSLIARPDSDEETRILADFSNRLINLSEFIPVGKLFYAR